MDEKKDVPEILSPGVYRGEDGKLRSARSGKIVAEHVGKPLSEERKRKMREGFERARAEGRVGGNKKTRARKEARERSVEEIATYRDEAISGLVEQMRDETASHQIRFNARKLILEYTDGKPTQKVEVEETTKIVYELGEFEPGPDAAAPGE